MMLPRGCPTAPSASGGIIVIHHSATPTGNADEFDKMHREKGWDELGYHFVIGNGTGSGDGQVEIGPRWVKQKHGAHAKVPGHPEYNDVGIGICLVGNFDVTRPTEAQMASLAQLVRFLMDRYNIPQVQRLRARPVETHRLPRPQLQLQRPVAAGGVGRTFRVTR